jgi:hypothetical protein
MIPAYLSVIPETGISRYPHYDYKVYDYVWYNLGECGQLSPEDRIYPYIGDANQAILVIWFGGTGKVIKIRAARIPGDVAVTIFDRTRWLHEPASRMTMVESCAEIFGVPLSSDGPLPRYSDSESSVAQGKSLGEVIHELGRTDGKKKVGHDAPWELSVSCPTVEWGNFDIIIYWPTVYPHPLTSRDHRVSDWIYFQRDF